jgi:hypothetical protein
LNSLSPQPGVPDEANVSTALEHAKSNLEEGLIRKLIPLDKGFRAR